MAEFSDWPDPPLKETKTRTVPLLVIAPACSIVLVAVLYLLLNPLMPSHIAIHAGPDGVGYGSALIMIAVACAIAAVTFVIGGATAREFLKDDHWFQTEKSIAVGIVSLGYGVIGFALATIFSIVGVDPEEVSVDSVGRGLLGFLLLFTAAVWIHVAVLPRARMQTITTTRGD